MAQPDIPVEHDAVFLRLLEPLSERAAMPLIASHLPRGLVWESFGYPAVRGRQGMFLAGKVDRSFDDETIPRDVELQCNSPDPPSNYKGFSGAPVVVDGSIRGIIQERLDGGIGAISLARLRNYLEAASVEFRADDRGYLPPSLARELEESIPNWRTYRRLEEELADPPGGYVVLSGHPGAGKTLISADFQPVDDRMFVVGRYFAGGYGGSELPPAYYRNLATFAQWLSAEASFKSSQAEGVRPDATTAEFARSITRNLEVIGSTIADDKLGILIIDGVEAAPTDTLPSFLEYLPSKPPERLTIVLTTNDPTSLLRKFDQLSVSKEVETLSLPLADCERIIVRKLGELVPLSQVVRIAELSEGNPLTLSYYVREIQAAIERGESEPWSVLEGSPDEYYLRVWNRFARDSPAQYLLALTARMRGPVPEDELFRIIPASQRVESVASFKALWYLYRVTDGGIRFYHESFRDFVLSQTTNLKRLLAEHHRGTCQV